MMSQKEDEAMKAAKEFKFKKAEAPPKRKTTLFKKG